MKIDLWEIFLWGVDYGQLLMEQERDSEDLFDAFQGVIIDQKYSAPSAIAPRRQPHSSEWRNAKINGYKKFLDLYATCGSTAEVVR
ncbi:MAG: hypothetical protein LBP59_10610 [Planctomycetaceae bacterium]|nr:hypothetical protein [Planctomycetaceae bacterium]